MTARRIAIAGALALSAAASPALAHDRHGGVALEDWTPPAWAPPPAPPPFRVDPALADRLERCGRVRHDDHPGGGFGLRGSAEIEPPLAPGQIDDCAALFEEGYDHPGGYYLVPVSVASDRPCVESTTTREIWTPAPRRIPPRAPPLRDKRTRLTPDKRLPM